MDAVHSTFYMNLRCHGPYLESHVMIILTFGLLLGALNNSIRSFKTKRQRKDVDTEREIPVSPKQLQKRPPLKMRIGLKGLPLTTSSNEIAPSSPAAVVRVKRLNLAKFRDSSFNKTR